ncbi:RNA ligase/cyclic nucleotide phosphodiesterase [Fusarium bulbicola]|nr:RNA ligase/cyclic nucleotide phosphodiesterase [Fusarium bulbicola]
MSSEAVLAPGDELLVAAVHTKFSPDGSALRYAGNTTVCHIPAESPLLVGPWDVYNTITSHPTLSKSFHLLPPDSWYMTVFDGVREEECEPGLVLEEEGLAPPYRMRAIGFQIGRFGMALDIVGATNEEERRMRRLRDRLADSFGFRAPNHLTYRFHVSIAYLIRWMGDEEKREFDKAIARLLPKIRCFT